jgi:hypothetical protein
MYTCSNPQLESSNYNKMNKNVGDDDADGRDAAVDDGDEAQSS